MVTRPPHDPRKALERLTKQPKHLLRQAVQSTLALREFKHFVRAGWQVHHPAEPIKWLWYLDAISEHLDAVYRREITTLIICMPPGLGKSMLVSVYWPAWIWLQQPHHQFICATNAAALTIRDSLRCRQLIESDWYQSAFRPAFEVSKTKFYDLDKEQSAKSYYKNSARGHRYSVGLTSRITGHRGHTIIIDDPLDAQKRFSRLARREVIDWWEGAAKSRMVKGSPIAPARVLVMQRLHGEDLAGHFEAVYPDAVVLRLCNEYDPALHCETRIGWSDPRGTEGMLLAPELIDAVETAALKSNLEIYNAQYQQDPVPEKGLIFERDWFRFHAPVLTPEQAEDPKWRKSPAASDITRRLTSWDMSFGSKRDTASECVGLAADMAGPDIYLRDGCAGRWAFTEACARMLDFIEENPGTHHYVEAKANGPAIIDALSRSIRGLIGVNPDKWGDKEARARAASGTVQSGHVYFPDPAKNPWVRTALEQICSFPAGKGDDWVDALVQLILKTQDTGGPYTLADYYRDKKRKQAEARSKKR